MSISLPTGTDIQEIAEENVFGCVKCGDSFSSGDLILKKKDKNEM